MRKFLVGVGLVASVAAVAALGACGKNNGDDATGDGHGSGPDACVGLQCQVMNCTAMGMPDTTISGRVFAPNGTLPLYDVNVYVPNTDPGPFTNTLTCSHCSDGLPGDPVTQQVTTEHGNFSLGSVPVGDNIPLVITIGKWRRQITIPHVNQCADNPIPAADTTLPKSRTDMTPHTKSVDMPNIAISTGGADALECLVRKLGIDDKEIKTDGQDGRIHLWTDSGATAGGNSGVGISKFKNGFAGGNGAFGNSLDLWGNATKPGKLANYDIVILSCEGDQHAETKSQDAMNHLKAYADAGGRVFMSHWHNIWIEGNTHNPNNGNHQAPTNSPMQWPTIAKFNDSSTTLGNGSKDLIDEVNNPKGTSFATWMIDPDVKGSTVQDQIAIQDGTGKNTCDSITAAAAEDWGNEADGTTPQMFQFTTPNDMDVNARCGKVVFSDMHVSGDSTSPENGSYPDACSASGLTPQEKALAFMFFDISSCVGSIF